MSETSITAGATASTGLVDRFARLVLAGALTAFVALTGAFTAVTGAFAAFVAAARAGVVVFAARVPRAVVRRVGSVTVHPWL
ncbi:hypothetical protein BOO86_13360 [Mycobacterium sp. CBMA 234]|nr:hypothetical protein [Mycolicibacterium sp. CBMA 234]